MVKLITSKEELLYHLKNTYGVIFLALFLVAITSAAVSKPWRPRRRRRPEQGIPGRLGLPFFGETFSFLSATNTTKGCYHFVSLRRQWYGKWFKTRIFGKIHVFVPSTEGARRILSNDFVEFNKGYFKSMADAIGENSLLCAPQQSHKRIRRLLADPFSMPSLSKFVNKIDQMFSLRLNHLAQKGESFSVLHFAMKITFDAMCDMLMSIKEESLLREIEKDSTAVSDAMLAIPLMIVGTRYYKGIKARQRLMETFRRIIQRRRNGKESHEDFLQSMLQRDSYPSNEKLDDKEIMDNLLTLLIAGQTTSAAAMMWCVKFLDDNREAQDRLREEQLSIARSKGDGSLLALEDLNRMSYGLKVMKETLRMSNIVLWFPRAALHDCTIEGFEIRKGWNVNVDVTCIHYDPALYKNPMQFNPSRFDEMQKPYSFIPFGSGPRTCLGMNMAKVTMLVFLHRLTSEYKWTVDNHDPSLEKKAHIPRLRSGCPITLKTIRAED